MSLGLRRRDSEFAAINVSPISECTAISDGHQVTCTSPQRDPPSQGVNDLRVTASTASTLTVAWTQVDDGAGQPAWYRVKYSAPRIDWKTATIGCDRTMEGDEIGAEMSCTIEGLAPATTYDVLMMSFRTEDGVWADARYSNPTTGTTGAGM